MQWSVKSQYPKLSRVCIYSHLYAGLVEDVCSEVCRPRHPKCVYAADSVHLRSIYAILLPDRRSGITYHTVRLMKDRYRDDMTAGTMRIQGRLLAQSGIFLVIEIREPNCAMCQKLNESLLRQRWHTFHQAIPSRFILRIGSSLVIIVVRITLVVNTSRCNIDRDHQNWSAVVREYSVDVPGDAGPRDIVIEQKKESDIDQHKEYVHSP